MCLFFVFLEFTYKGEVRSFSYRGGLGFDFRRFDMGGFCRVWGDI